MNDEAQLINLARRGNTLAFGQLVRLYQDRLYNTMMHVVGCHAEAEDVVQDAFVQAFIKLDSFQQNSAFYTWLYRIAFNRAVTRRRRRRPEVSVSDRGELMRHEPLDPGDAPQDRMLREERVGQVQAALATLTEEHRAVLVLREMEGCDYETIASILGLSVGTVRSRLHRGRMQLREQLKDILQGQPTE